MTNWDDGQIHGWNGGDCPVHPETVVEYWTRDWTGGRCDAGCLGWEHRGNGDIIAFRVVKEYVEPKVIWVNETEGVVYEAYTSEEAARLTVYHNTTRIAVKYVECKE